MDLPVKNAQVQSEHHEHENVEGHPLEDLIFHLVTASKIFDPSPYIQRYSSPSTNINNLFFAG